MISMVIFHEDISWRYVSVHSWSCAYQFTWRFVSKWRWVSVQFSCECY
jgi:hypothetical protein